MVTIGQKQGDDKNPIVTLGDDGDDGDDTNIKTSSPKVFLKNNFSFFIYMCIREVCEWTKMGG